jgi:hypothetical protein
MLKHYRGSHVRALMDLYPELRFQKEKFLSWQGLL